MLLVMEKSKAKIGASVSNGFDFLTEVQWDISDLPFAQSKNYQY